MAKIDSLKKETEEISKEDLLERLKEMQWQLKELRKEYDSTVDINKKIAYQRENNQDKNPQYSYGIWNGKPVSSWKMVIDRVYDGGKTEEQVIRVFTADGKHEDVSYTNFTRWVIYSSKKPATSIHIENGEKKINILHDDWKNYEFSEKFLNP